MKPRKNEARYDLALVKHLVRRGRYAETKKSTQWLRSHGYDALIAKRMVLSLESDEFVESLRPEREGGLWADVYCCDYEDEEIEGAFYLKFVVSEGSLVVTLMSCKEWGYAW